MYDQQKEWRKADKADRDELAFKQLSYGLIEAIGLMGGAISLS